MNRPRIVAIVSAVAASTAAFAVTSRYHLAGTLAGAALVPVIWVMVSHSSTEGADALHKWVRRRRGSGAEAGGSDASASEDIETPTPRRASLYTQWVLVGLTCVAVATSVYTLVAPHDPTVVRETVIERITESTDGGEATGSATKADSGGTTPTTVTTAAADPVTTTTDPTLTTTTTVAKPSETTTTSTADGNGSSSTTDTTQATGTSLP